MKKKSIRNFVIYHLTLEFSNLFNDLLFFTTTTHTQFNILITIFKQNYLLFGFVFFFISKNTLLKFQTNRHIKENKASIYDYANMNMNWNFSIYMSAGNSIEINMPVWIFSTSFTHLHFILICKWEPLPTLVLLAQELFRVATACVGVCVSMSVCSSYIFFYHNKNQGYLIQCLTPSDTKPK